MARPTKGQQAEHNEQIARARKKIADAGIVDLLIDVARGFPIAEYEPRTSARQKKGKVKRLVQPNIDQRLRAASDLVGRAIPTLKAVEVGQSDGGMKITIETNGVGIPGQSEVVEGTVAKAVEKQVDVLNEIIEAEVIEDDEEAGT